MSAAQDRLLQKRFRYLEWAVIVLTALVQLIWTGAFVLFDQYIGASFLLLATTSMVSFFTPRSVLWRVVQLAVQTVLISLASALGDHHYFYLNLYVLGAKAALLLPKWQMLGVAAMITLSHIGAGQFAVHAMHNIHMHRVPEPVNYNSIVVEVEKIIYFIIELATVIFLGKVLTSERKNLSAEQVLATEVGDLAVGLERSRIARDIHDGLGHTLTSLRIQLELAGRLLDAGQPDAARDLLIKCQDCANESLQQVRRAVRTERDGSFSLTQSLNELVEQINEQVKMKFEIRVENYDLTLGVQEQTFSIIQECLTNIRKHSAADTVQISLTKSEGMMNLRVRDNGKGFDLQSVTSGFGLKGLRERAQTIGATIEIESRPGQGTDITLCFPALSRKDSGTIRVF